MVSYDNKLRKKVNRKAERERKFCEKRSNAKIRRT